HRETPWLAVCFEARLRLAAGLAFSIDIAGRRLQLASALGRPGSTRAATLAPRHGPAVDAAARRDLTAPPALAHARTAALTSSVHRSACALAHAYPLASAITGDARVGFGLAPRICLAHAFAYHAELSWLAAHLDRSGIASAGHVALGLAAKLRLRVDRASRR